MTHEELIRWHEDRARDYALDNATIAAHRETAEALRKSQPQLPVIDDAKLREIPMHQNNSALCSFAQRWRIDGDYIRCVECNRPQLATYALNPFFHAQHCPRATASDPTPWLTFVELLAPITAALSAPVVSQSLTTPPNQFVDANKMVPEGFALVPIVPTALMMDAAISPRNQDQTGRRERAIYDAMIAARPQVQGVSHE